MFECSACSAGTFASTSRASRCEPCGENHFAAASGASQCESCGAGTYADVGSSICTSCGIWYAGDGGHCDTPVFGILFGLAIGAIFLGIVVFVYRRYSRVVDAMKLQEERGVSMERDIQLLQSAWLLDWDQITVEKKLAEGGGGAVYFARMQGMDVAVKTIFNTKDVDISKQSEVQWMQRARHPRLLLFFGVGRHPSRDIFVVIEYMSEGDLLNLFTTSRESKSLLPWRTRLRLLLDVAEGMRYVFTRRERRTSLESSLSSSPHVL